MVDLLLATATALEPPMKRHANEVNLRAVHADCCIALKNTKSIYALIALTIQEY